MTLKTRKPTGAVPWPLILVEGEEKSGKAQPLNARIATPSGWTTMGELAVGSRVIGSNGRPTTVTAVYERGERDIYRLTFSDGAEVEACDEHLWATTTSSALHCQYNKGPKKGQRNYRPLVTRTTTELRDKVLNGIVVHIPMAAPVQYDPGEVLPFDPYALGLLLGDGCMAKPSYPVYTSGDPELFDSLAAVLPAGDSLTRLKSGKEAGIKGGRTTMALRSMGLMGAKSEGKFIPPSYMTSTAADRLALLQGLMDTDGGMERKSITFTSVSYLMACQVQELVRSLGGSCSMRSKEPSYRGADGSLVACKTAYTLRMRLPLGACPFRLNRKVERWTELRPGFNTPPRRTVKAVEYVGKMPARCITVDAPDHLYLTDHFIVTHNSYACAVLSASPKVGRTLWLDLNEGAADEYIAVPGARYEVIDHDGSWASIVGQVADAKTEAQRAKDAGEKPVVLAIDTGTAEWDLLKTWVDSRARLTDSNKKKLAADPNAEVSAPMNLWNDANARHRKLMTMLMTFPGIVIVTARGKEVAALDAKGSPIAGTKEYKVEGNKSLAYDVSCWVRTFRDKPAVVVGARSVHNGVRPGKDKPRELNLDWTLEFLIFEALKCDPAGAHVRNLAEMRPARGQQEIRDEALRPATDFGRVRELYAEAQESGYSETEVVNESQDQELLLKLLHRVGEDKRKAEMPQRPTAVRSAPPSAPSAPPAANEEEFTLDFLARLNEAADEDLGGMQAEVSRAMGAGIITPATASELLTNVKHRRTETRKPVAA